MVDAAAEKATIAGARKEATLGAAAERESAVSLARKREETLVARAEAREARGVRHQPTMGRLLAEGQLLRH